MSTISELKVYSIGIVADNSKLVGEDGKSFNRVIEVTPVEDSPMLDGEINSDKVTDKVSSEDSSNVKVEIKTTTANSIKATWLPMGSSNRFTAPQVRRGERVVLYRFSDEDVFYWTTLFDDIQLRKLETVIYAFSATKDEAVKDVTAENYYFLEVSTHKGLVHFSTSQANGEYASYDVQINAKEGFISFEDNLKNKFMFDSKEKQISMINSDGTYFEINRMNLTMNVPETYTLIAKNVVEKIGEAIVTEAGKSISEKTGTFDLKASGAVNQSAGGATNIKAGGAMTIKGNGVDISGPVALH